MIYSQGAPNHRGRWNGSIIGIGVQDLTWTRIEAIVGANLPQLRAVGIWIRDTKEDESRYGIQELKDHQANNYLRPSPFPCNMDHFDGRLFLVLSL
jgi:hypothetical protein